MIWTAETMRTVRSLAVRFDLDRQLAEDEHAKAAARSQLSKSLVEYGRTMAVEICPEDIAHGESSDSPFDRLRMTARWLPSTTCVEFRGGRMDGQVIEVAPGLVGTPIRVADARPVEWDAALTHASTPMPSVIEYVPGGWHEAERRWIYELE